MDVARNYHRMALDCLKMAETTRDPASQDSLIRLAEHWASLADREEQRLSGPSGARSR